MAAASGTAFGFARIGGGLRRFGWLCASIGLAGLTAHAAGAADTLTVYRCTGSDGRIRLQDRPCAATEREQTREVRRVGNAAPRAAPAADADTEAEAPAAPARRVSAEPAPALWRCVDFEGTTRYAETDERNGRWVPAWVVGADPRAQPRSLDQAGRPRPRPPAERPGLPANSEIGVVGPMVWIEDSCQLLPLAERCTAWREQAAQAERTRYNRTGDEKRAAEAEIARLRTLADAYCPGR